MILRSRFADALFNLTQRCKICVVFFVGNAIILIFTLYDVVYKFQRRREVVTSSRAIKKDTVLCMLMPCETCDHRVSKYKILKNVSFEK